MFIIIKKLSPVYYLRTKRKLRIRLCFLKFRQIVDQNNWKLFLLEPQSLNLFIFKNLFCHYYNHDQKETSETHHFSII